MCFHENDRQDFSSFLQGVLEWVGDYTISGMVFDSETTPGWAVVLRDMQQRVHIVLQNESGCSRHFTAQNVPDAVRTLYDLGYTKVAQRPNLFGHVEKTPKGVKAMLFSDISMALMFRYLNGGWIFESEQRIIWFDLSFKPTDICLHPFTNGLDGKLI